MKPFSDALKIVTQEDIELAKRTPAPGDDVDPAKLMDLLGDIDSLKHEIHERMRRIEAVKQAKSVLQEDAERTEALNRRLAEIGKAMSVAHVGILAGEGEKEAPEPLRMPTKEPLAGATASQRQGIESPALPWLVVEEGSGTGDNAAVESVAAVSEDSAPSEPQAAQTQSSQAQSLPAQLPPAPLMSEASSAAFEAALERLEGVEEARTQAWVQADEAMQEARRLLDEANLQLRQAVEKEEQATADFQLAQRALTAAYESANGRLEQAEAARAQSWAQANETAEEARRLLQQATEQVHQAVGREEAAALRFHSAQDALTVTVQAATERLEELEAERTKTWNEKWNQANEASHEARRLFEEAKDLLNRAVSREEDIAGQFLAAKEGLTAAAQTAMERMEEAERSWKKTEIAAHEGKKLFDQSTSELVLARKKEETLAANLQSVRKEFVAAYESACDRLREAEQFWQRGDQSSQDAQKLGDLSTAELLQARSAAEAAASDLLSARQELTTAYQFAAVAAQRRLDAVEFFQKAARWTVYAGSLSWVAMVWVAWFAFRSVIPIWGAAAMTVIIVLAAILIVKRGATES